MDGNLFIPLPEQRAVRGPINMLLADHVDWVVSLILSVLFVLGVGIVIFLLLLGFGLIVGLPLYVVVRHHTVTSRRSVARRAANNGLGDSGLLVFVMGSGGHTTEMISMIDRSIRSIPGTWRRYVINEDDTLSKNRIIELEEHIAKRLRNIRSDPGRFDIVRVTRARKVHQSWWTTPSTALQSLVTMKRVFLGLDHQGPFQYPRTVFTNGPGTGFIVLLAVHILRIFKAFPDHATKTVFIESFARPRTLSLSGKLIHYLNIADVFLVQWPEVAQRYGKVLGSSFVIRPADPIIPYVEQ
ncbi:UDP-N-acetylglucosamine transferase subunit [Diatrype stigma]|uniref:UDP-N-acetylglucosamine transferase subunit ALG14 n=1 Tax=Diatrype stigma TaxID=117547 RepID=A0AAN9U614_9PEZI